MFRLINQELQDLTRPLDFITPGDAQVAVKAVIEKLACLTDAYIVDVYWKKNPVTGGDVLDPFVWIRTESKQPSSIIVTEEEGILPWVFKKGKVAWIDEVKKKDWSKPVLNLAAVDASKFEQKPGVKSQDYNEKEESDKFIQPSAKIDSFSEPTEAIIAMPLKHRGIIWGLISLEYKKTKKYDRDMLKQMQKITLNLACLIWKSDIYEQNNAETREAVEEFAKVISKEEIVPLTHEPTCFFSREFDEAGKFEEIEKKVWQIISIIPNIKFTSNRPQGKDFVLKEIIDGIKRSHFCIADITGQNPNVMIELGMMMMYGKDIIILKSSEDESPIPFDINQSNIYIYKCKDDELYIRYPSGSKFIPFETQLKQLAEGYIKPQE